MSDKQLTTTEPSALAVAQPQGLNLGAISERILSGELTPEKLTMIKDLVAMDAERQFNADFLTLMRKIPTIKATKPVPDKHGNLKYMAAPFEEIDEQVRPLALNHGFTYTFSEGDFLQGKIAKVCTVSHVGGHSRSHKYSVRIGAGPPGCNESQADGSAHSYAKRGALCDAFSIAIDRSFEQDDARMEGGTISADEAIELKRRAKACGADLDKFLKFAGAADFDSISDSRLQTLLDFLEKKEVQKKTKNEPAAEQDFVWEGDKK